MSEYMQKYELICGPMAISKKLSISVDQVLKDWPVKWVNKKSHKSKIFHLPIDTHIHHKAYLKSKGYGITMLDKPEVGAIVLLNDNLFDRHWGIVHSFEKDGRVNVNWLTVPDEGDGEFEIITFSQEAFEKKQNTWPDFMYKIGGDPVELNWLEKLYIFISGW